MVNFRSVSIKGAFNFGRARVLWQAGMLKVFDADGLKLSTPAEEPVRKAGHLRAWSVKTSRGDIAMRGKCMTCGGRKWSRITYMSDSKLWVTT